jgi:hypothetical protein
MSPRQLGYLPALTCALCITTYASSASAQQQLKLPSSGATIAIPAGIGTWQAGGDPQKGVDLLQRQGDPGYLVMLTASRFDQQITSCATAFSSLGAGNLSPHNGLLGPEWYGQAALTYDSAKSTTVLLGCAQDTSRFLLGVFTFGGAPSNSEFSRNNATLSSAIARGYGLGGQAPASQPPPQPVQANQNQGGQTLTLPVSGITLTMPANTGTWQASSKDDADFMLRTSPQTPRVIVMLGTHNDPDGQVCPKLMAKVIQESPNNRKPAGPLFTSAWHPDAVERRAADESLVTGCIRRADGRATFVMLGIQGAISDDDLYTLTRGFGGALGSGQAPAPQPQSQPQRPVAKNDFGPDGGILDTGNLNPPPVAKSDPPPYTPPQGNSYVVEEEDDFFEFDSVEAISLSPHIFMLLPEADYLKALLGFGMNTRLSYAIGRPFGFLIEADLMLAEDSVTKIVLDAHAAAGLSLSISNILYIAALGVAGADGFGVASLASDDAANSYEFPFKTYYGAEGRVGIGGLFTLSAAMLRRPDRTEKRFALNVPIRGNVALHVQHTNYEDAKSYALGVALRF